MGDPVVISSNLDEVLRALHALGQDVSQGMDGLATEAANELERQTSPITATWDHPDGHFVVDARAETSPPLAEARLSVSGLVQMLDAGARPHLIAARRAPCLAFVWDGPGSYRPKTTPRLLASQAGGPMGELVFFQSVNHPGFEGRRWIEVLADGARRWFPEMVTKWVKWALDNMPGVRP